MTPTGPAVARTAATAALGLAGVCAAYVLGVLLTGLALGSAALRGTVVQRVGYVASTGVDLRLGLGLVLAAALGALALADAEDRQSPAPPAARPALLLVVAAAALAALLALLAVPAQLHALDLQRQHTTTAFNLGQVTYVVGTVGAAVVAALVAANGLGRPSRTALDLDPDATGL